MNTLNSHVHLIYQINQVLVKLILEIHVLPKSEAFLPKLLLARNSSTLTTQLHQIVDTNAHTL